MAFGGLNSGGGSGQPQAEINMVPLIDVMLVLLVIFMITAPLLSHSIVIDLPQVTSQQVKEDPEIIDLAVDESGQIFWNEQPVAKDELPARLREIATRQPQPDLRLRADRNTRYELLAEIMGDATRAGVKGLGFVTTPGATKPAADALPGAEQPAS
ncbi:biopolymer transporter ExbD [Verticiella sediminum]|uniref:Biopolymer transporter ExbD n=1 Tax=Verticiella sediminum TaxID=1247510 RepID=A0A556A932_9BURK|nr:biopolymer transporter ExbD [Verticiella sediminum]TSH89385.1 biopolymer transporter ExbD [Verticiella sediminum]